MKKILLALQYWAGDANQAYRLADFLADLESKKSESADFLLVSRFDCPQNLDVAARLSKKFNVYNFVSRRRGIGWPVGPQELWLAVMEWVFHMKTAKKIPDYSAVFTFEPDNVPLVRGWIDYFQIAWELEWKKRKGKLATMGAMIPSGPKGKHINGNALFSADLNILSNLLKIVNRCPPSQGWDYYGAPEFEQIGWAEIPGVKSYWNTKTLSEKSCADEFAAGTLWIHGIKDDSLLDFSKHKLLGQ
jgi:uncharacterized protein YdeI (YjbR/CyaY-like superfamily)